MVSFIGSGRVARSFGKYIAEHGVQLGGFYDVFPQKAQEAAEFCGSRVFRSLRELLAESQIIFISTNDDQIQQAAKELLAEKNTEEIAVGHFSGVHNSTVLSGILSDNHYCFSLHPLQSFSGTESDLISMADTFITIEGQPKAIEIIQTITENIDNTVLTIEPEQKVMYHAAGVVASNYVTTVIAESLSYLEIIGIDREQALKMLKPLVMGTVANAFSIGPEQSLTGPVARGDYQTVNTHIRQLHQADEEKEQLYKELGLATLKLAEEKLLTDNNTINQIKQLFREEYK